MRDQAIISIAWARDVLAVLTLSCLYRGRTRNLRWREVSLLLMKGAKDIGKGQAKVQSQHKLDTTVDPPHPAERPAGLLDRASGSLLKLGVFSSATFEQHITCLLYTSDAADDANVV